ncbi:rhomboid family intramembrane serine protease [Candidatus Woesearchaeota archaeon]|nr:rhomboid family intramembrane serine protease [Candidatus Woesearchaeota archaeon]
MKKIFLVTGILVFIFLVVFSFFPNSQNLLSFSGIKFLSGEFYRIITFPFVHVNISHLIENLIAITLVSFLGYEFGLRGKEFVSYFFLVSILIALGDAFLFPLFVIAGASLGIYGVLGALSIKGSNFIPKKVLIPVFIISILYKLILDVLSSETITNLDQTMFHLSGFFAGMIFFVLPRFKKRKRILLREKRFYY